MIHGAVGLCARVIMLRLETALFLAAEVDLAVRFMLLGRGEISERVDNFESMDVGKKKALAIRTFKVVDSTAVNVEPTSFDLRERFTHDATLLTSRRFNPQPYCRPGMWRVKSYDPVRETIGQQGPGTG